MNAPLDPPTAPMALTPPTPEAAAWCRSALTAATDLRRALTRLSVDHRRELTDWQGDELGAARNHTAALHGILNLLDFQLSRSVTPTADPVAWRAAVVVPPTAEELEAAEAVADLEYDQHTNAI